VPALRALCHPSAVQTGPIAVSPDAIARTRSQCVFGQVPESQQWAETTLSRLVRDGYSWIAAVMWAVDRKLHPRMNSTTVRVARELARHRVCRPGILGLMARLRLKRRCVQYHLAALRESGLLVYELRGTRRKGASPLATVYRFGVPTSFDSAFDVRTAGEGPLRRMTGMSADGRARLEPYARRAVRPRRRQRRTAARTRRPCTPIQTSSGSSSPAAPPPLPSDHGGENRSVPPTRRKRARGVRRRFQLAAELKGRVAWLGRAPVPRIAWAVQEVADAGWSADAVMAWLQLQDPPLQVLHPSGFLLRRLAGASGIWTTIEQRDSAVSAARADARRRARAREANRWAGGTPRPVVAAAIGQALAEGRRRYVARQHDAGLDDLLSTAPRPDSTWQPPGKAWHQAAADLRALLSRPSQGAR
jgi:hypothetical protein